MKFLETRGSILDSSVVIGSQRRKESSSSLIRRVLAITGDQELALSAIGYTELIHGIYRDTMAARKLAAESFLEELTQQMPVLAYTRDVAELAGRLDAEQQLAGLAIPFIDLLIGATALSYNYSLLTTNIRHFRLIPGLDVISF